MNDSVQTSKTSQELMEEISFLRDQLARLQEQESSKQRLHQRHARLIVDGMYQFAALLDASGKMVDVNSTALQAGGVHRDDVLGKYVWETPWLQVSSEVIDQCRNDVLMAASGQFVRHDLDVYGADAGAEIINVDWSLNPIYDEAGALWIVAEGRNITETKRAQAEVARKTEELQQAHERLQEFDRLKTEFFANVSHELRTPLMLILGPVRQFLAREGLAPDERESLQVVERNAGLLLQQVNNLLDLAKLEASGLRPDYSEIDLAELFRLTVGYFDGLAQERGIDYRLQTPSSMPTELDPNKVQRILLNLLSNAFKFTPDEGQISCELSVDGDRATLVVEDSGPGIPDDQRESIFDRFRQLQGSSNREVGGTGLGLSIAREFVELQGGTITVAHSPLGGARFQITLPITAPEGTEINQSTRPEDPPDLGRATVDALRSYRPPQISDPSPPPQSALPIVLVVEDNQDMNVFISRILGSRYRVVSAYNGEEGLLMARRLQPDLIVTDIMMPKMSGDQMIGELSSDPSLQEIPVIVLTAKASDRQRVDLLQKTWVRDHITKPFQADEFLARVDGMIQRRRATIRTLSQINAQLQQREVELETALETVQFARKQAEIASKLKGDFLSLVSHELRTPLASLRLQIDQLDLLHHRLPPGMQSIVERMYVQWHRLRNLIEGVLDYTRIQGDRLWIKAEDINLHSLARDCLEEMQGNADAKELDLRLQIADDLPILRSDARLVRLILINLLTNAIKFTDSGSATLKVSQTMDGDFTITVTDTGPGIPHDQQARIFEPFEQVESIGNKHQVGMGLGLSLVREVVESLGGTISVNSQPGHGSTFTVTLGSMEPINSPE